jgi:hypothetical protein
MGGWAIAQSPILNTTITIARLTQRGYEPLLTHYFFSLGFTILIRKNEAVLAGGFILTFINLAAKLKI